MISLSITFILISIFVTTSLGLLDPYSQANRCQEQKSYKMLGYFCNNLQLDQVPRKMRSSIEILDVSYNRIRELRRDSFSPCKDVKFIYLQVNVLVHIESGTFSDLKKLEVLDLSENAIRELPAEIFDLPYLRHLYLERNNIMSFDNIPKPIKAPLKKLNLANNYLETIPHQFGILPDLHHLNISSNYMRDLTPQQFSPFCNLKEVDLNNTAMHKCRCMEIVDFLTINRHIEISTYPCKASSSGECSSISGYKTISLNETEDYHTCMSITRQVIENEEARFTWGVVGISVLSFLFVFISLLYCIHRRNVRQMQRRSKMTTNGRGVIQVQNNLPNSDELTNSPDKLLIKKSEV